MTRFLLRSLCAAFLAVAFSASADIPVGYYNSLDGKKDAELKTAVYNIIHDFTLTGNSYSQIYSALNKTFRLTDTRPQTSYWWDMYSNINRSNSSFSGLNREHSFPKSWWGGNQECSAYIDLNHLYPSDAAANMAKSNYPLGVVDMAQAVDYNNGVVKVGFPVRGQGDGAGLVFEPADEYKGDFARTYFYMVTCYQNYTWAKKYMWMLRQDSYPTLKDWAINLLLDWARNDEVSDKEVTRNDAVYRIQNNRNPFIDIPVLAEYIWGSKKGQVFRLADAGIGDNTPTGDPVLYTPVQGMTLDFGQVAVGKSVTAKLFFRGENIRVPFSILIYSGDKQYFTSASKTIAASAVNSADGYWLTVTYSPAEIGEHSSYLLVSDGGIPGSLGVELRGECFPTPVLSACVATDATDITSDSYVANWEEPADVVDYYIVTRTRYAGNSVSESEEIAETNSLVMEGFNQSDREAYSVQSVRLGYRSPMSNVIFVNHAGITGVEVDEPLSVIAIEGGIRFICNAPQTGARVYDVTGRLVKEIPAIDNDYDVALPFGIYFVTTDQCRRPIRVATK